MTKLERDEEAAIKKWCKANDVLFIKFTPFGEKGWPDRIAIFPDGHHVWVELKRRGEHPRPLQFHRMHLLEGHGVDVMWFDCAEKCIEYFEEILCPN